METLINSAIRSFRSIFAPGMGKVFIKSILITIACLIAFIFVATFAADQLSNLLTNTFLKTYIAWIVGFGTTFIAWFLFPGIMPWITSFFNDEIIEIIERHHYSITDIKKPTLMEDIAFETKFALKAIFLNIVVLPLYLIPLINIFLFLFLNGYLLGSQFFLSVARRHLSPQDSNELKKKYSRQIMIGGIAITFFATIPLINLVIPFWGIALMTHLFHLGNRETA